MRLGVGLLIGGFITGAMLIALFTLTGFEVERVQNQTLIAFLLASLVFIPLALMEELLFRGYPFFRLSQIINVRWVILITAFLFAIYHYNGSASIASLFLGPGVWGVTFGVAAYLSNSIAVPLGIHTAANLLQAMFGLKAGSASIWVVTNTVTQPGNGLEVESLGLIMQLSLLIISVVIFEINYYK